MLTATAVRKLRPGSIRREIPDAGARGLILVIQPSGVKSWAMRFRRPDGRHAKLTLGRADLIGKEIEGGPVLGGPLTLPAARQLAADIHRQRAMGRDVVADAKSAKLHRIDVERRLFPAAARDYVQQYAQPNVKSWQSIAGVLGLAGDDIIKGGLAERWGNRAVAEITGDDIWLLIEEARQHGIPGRAVRCRGASEARAREMAGALSQLFGWLLRKRRITINPTAGLERPAPPAARHRVFNVDAAARSADELRWFWTACGTVNEPFASFCKMLLLTGARRAEVAGLTRDELSDDLATWTLPGARTKNGRPHVIPLPAMAREILGPLLEAPPTGGAGYVFTTTGRTPVSGFSKLKPQLDRAMLAAARAEGVETIAPWRLHDLRRSAATGMAELGVQPHIVEAVLNHVSGSRAGIAGVYNRALYANEKRAALERWAAHIQSIVSGVTSPKVVPLRRR